MTKMTQAALVDFLKMTLEEVERGGSYEGRLTYTCIDDRCKPGEFMVSAFIRNGNDEGQGGCWLIEEGAGEGEDGSVP